LRFGLVVSLNGNNDLVHCITFSAGDCDRDAATEQHHGWFGLVNKEFQVPQWLRAGTRHGLHSGRTPLMVIAASIWREKFSFVAVLCAVSRCAEWVTNIRYFFKGWVDRLRYLERVP
jgi:hypothetical protein